MKLTKGNENLKNDRSRIESPSMIIGRGVCKNGNSKMDTIVNALVVAKSIKSYNY